MVRFAASRTAKPLPTIRRLDWLRALHACCKVFCSRSK
jgi:hypothetical protein